MTISFSGNDGSGKTTICNALLAELYKKGIQVEYRHEYDYVFLKWVFKIFGSKFVEKQRAQFLNRNTQQKNVSEKSGLIGTLWPYVVWFDNLLTVYYYKIFYRHKLIILDRYPYDMYLSFVYLNKATSVLKKLFYMIPKADLQIIFYADPAVAMERKKDTHNYDLSFYETQLGRYKQIATDLNIEMHKTEESLQDTVNFVMTRLQEHAPQCLKNELSRG